MTMYSSSGGQSAALNQKNRDGAQLFTFLEDNYYTILHRKTKLCGEGVEGLDTILGSMRDQINSLQAHRSANNRLELEKTEWVDRQMDHSQSQNKYVHSYYIGRPSLLRSVPHTIDRDSAQSNQNPKLRPKHQSPNLHPNLVRKNSSLDKLNYVFKC